MAELPAVLLTGVGYRHGRTPALRDCSLSVPPGRVVGLIGPNGAGKTTLLHLMVGLLRPDRGEVRIFGREPGGDPAILDRVAFLAQDKPLYGSFTVAETMRLGRHLNSRWSDELAAERLGRLGIPADRPVRRLSGGQRSQVAITLAMAKRPDLMVLDEPLADLDPLRRHEVMSDLMALTAETGMTVVLSSHVVAELEETCDHLVLLGDGRVQLAGDLDEVRAGHHALSGPASLVAALPDAGTVVHATRTGEHAGLLWRSDRPPPDPRWAVRTPAIGDIVLAYLRAPEASALPRPTLLRQVSPGLRPVQTAPTASEESR
ncbi:ABC transporter ATP-binding protein [Plantactinospora endophytica]|uniref:ABC transporter ATP-binding protein n=1 Tax=Plantactinospora endophytica TaxID=673535 RepID=A0ABQ4E8T9_9ACTN|nr:ABC transporter ATP-binding protein [Plantactinospora endophytica]GIG91152.1 ABC transporter ATP-binding protein [Plantactinospora endophytica]